MPEQNNSQKSKRIAKNTFVLYVRMIFLMLISLYTSRVILDVLGVDDFGIYNVVGGFVALFAIVSKSLSGAASRFLNYAMGTGDRDGIKTVFSTTVTIQYALAILIALLSEIIGGWFVNNKMVIPADRMIAANWCFQLSVITFCSNLITVPYNAAIIAHERMKAFAFVSIFEGIAKLAISFLIIVSPIDKLVFYAICLSLLQLSIQAMYRIYCRKQFEECKYNFIYDKKLFVSILSYSGWGIIGSTSGVLRNQGINVLINIFFGPAINAARGVSNQVLHSVDGFVNNFITAVKPQITQSYASGDYEYMNKLIYASAKFSFYLFLLLSMPIILNADYMLGIWLKAVPEHSVTFVQLTLVFTLITTLSHPLSIAQAATGDIRNYQLIIGGLQLFNLPISYLLLKIGFEPECVLYVAIGFAIMVVFVSMYMIKRLIPLDIIIYLMVIIRVTIVAVLAFLLSYIIGFLMSDGIIFSLLKIVFSFIITAFVIFFIGCSTSERDMLLCKLRSLYIKFRK